jgi:CubicO group peptidase (beta-lactamase class C family)
MDTQTFSQETSTLDLSPLEQRVKEAMPHFSVPGVALGVYHAGRTASAGLGITNLEHPLPVNEHTLFQIGSITKTFTATMIMRLVEEGRLELDAPVQRYLPDLRLKDPGAAGRVTVRHLLTHTAGWAGDYFADFGRGDGALSRYVASLEVLEQLTAPGELYAYNNAGFSLAGRLIEIATGKTYESAARELALEPLGMVRSFFFAEEVITHRAAVGHTVTQEREVTVARPWALARSASAAGSLISCVSDLLRYARFVLGDGILPGDEPPSKGDRLLQPESMRLMHTPQVPTATPGEWIGLSWFIRQMGDVKVLRHGGATHGQCAQFLVVPERDFALVILTNSDYGSSLYGEVTGWTLNHFLNISQIEPPILARKEQELDPLTGCYEAQMDWLEVSAGDGMLVVQDHPKGGFPDVDSPPPPTPPPDIFAFVDETHLVCVEGLSKGSYGRFLVHPDGRVAWLQLGGRLHRKMHLTEGANA